MFCWVGCLADIHGVFFLRFLFLLADASPPEEVARTSSLLADASPPEEVEHLHILLAYALLTVVLYSYNSTEKNHGQTITKPIITSSFFHTDNSSDVHVIGIVPSVQKDQTLNNTNTWEISISETIVGMETVLPIYLRSLRKHHIYMSLKRMGLYNLQSCTINFAAYGCDPAVFKDCGKFDLDLVKEKLSAYGLTLAVTPPDGNCFFTAFAMNLLSYMSTWSPTLSLAGMQSNKQLSCWHETTAQRDHGRLGDTRSDYGRLGETRGD